MSSRDLLDALFRASLEGGLVLLFLWSVTRLWPRMPAAARRWLWWLGAVRMILGLLPIPYVRLDWKPSWTPVVSATTAATDRMAELGDAIGNTPIAAVTPDARPDLWQSAGLVVLGLWVAGALASLILLALRLRRLGRLWHEARPFDDPRALAWRSEWALALGSARAPLIRVSPEVQAPLAVGIRRPGILLPEGSERMSDDALRLVFAHELSHLRRRDPLLGWIPAAAETLFWFHPLVRLASREYLAAREELCDLDALRATSASPRDYGALLVDFAVGRHDVLPSVASCGTTAGRALKRRLDMLSKHHSISLLQRAGVAVCVVAFALIGFTPVRLSAGLEMHGSQKIGRKPSPMAYMIKIAGKKGTRGNIDLPADLAAARDLERWNRTALYLRFGNKRWIVYDAVTIAEIKQALADQDELDARRTPAEKKRDEIERDYETLDMRRDALESQKERLSEKRSAIEDKWQAAKDDGKSTSGLEAQKEQLDKEYDELERRFDELTRARDRLSAQLEQLEIEDKAYEKEQDRIERESMQQIERIGRRAIEKGLAESYEAGGSASEQVRPSTWKVFSPGTTIW